MTLNVAVDIRTDLGPVRDQGRRPTCLAFAASDAHRHSRQHETLLCVEWLYYHAIKLAGAGPRNGTTIPNTRTVLRSIGQPEERDWPYSSALPDEARWVAPKPRTSLLTCGSNQCTNGVDVIRNHLDTCTPVIVGVYLSSTFRVPIDWTHIGGEVLLAPNLGEPIDFSDGHAMVVVGHGTYNGDLLVLLRNSWGPRWGSNGHAWVREDYLAPRLAGAFVITKGKDDVL